MAPKNSMAADGGRLPMAPKKSMACGRQSRPHAIDFFARVSRPVSLQQFAISRSADVEFSLSASIKSIRCFAAGELAKDMHICPAWQQPLIEKAQHIKGIVKRQIRGVRNRPQSGDTKTRLGRQRA